ncbi:HAD family hydrolase [Prevotella sp.]|uniref:HAD family hydrolase n=1 Tax=Prevotella sp. TaxID=59823 RepID=UPI003DA67359
MNYKNIIFDLGNVLVKLDEDATMKAFENLGMGRYKHLRENPEALKLFQAMGIGMISNQDFFNAFRKIVNPNATDKQITDATNAMLITIPDVKKQKLMDLRKAGYRTFLLSNTIDLHWRYCKDELFPMDNFTVDDYFEHTFTSQKMHMKKPDDEIFQTVIQETGIKPNETIFIDDLEVNCNAAERNGIHAFQNKEFDDWMKLFS